MRRQHPAVESAINSLEHRGLDRVRTHGTEGFARMVALSVGGEPAPPGAAPATAGAGRQETTQTTRRLIGGGVAHTSAFEPAPEETGTAPYGRVPKIGAGPPPITPPRPMRWHLPGRNWAATGAESVVDRDRKAPIEGFSGRHYLLDLDEVFAFQADREIVWIRTRDKSYMATQTLQAIDDRFSGTQFQRVHRSVLVNLDKVRKISVLSSQRWLLTLTNGLEYTVSKRQVPLLRDLLG